jgi:hypothetical protein
VKQRLEVDDTANPGAILERLRRFGAVLAIKLYRLSLEPPPALPLLPCLDHEAMLHGGIDPHLAVYLQEANTGELHELVFTPARRLIAIDTVSTWNESSVESRRRLEATLTRALPGWRVRTLGPSWWRGERRVASACRAQVSLRDVLLGPDIEAVSVRVSRLQTIGTLMEKQSRVASWGVRTVTGPLLAAAGVATYVALGSLHPRLSEQTVTGLRYAVVGLLGVTILYYGLKAVQLTEMSNRVWKRAAEYGLILAERKRLAARARDARPAPPQTSQGP